MADHKEKKFPRATLPAELSKIVQIPMHPEIHKEVKIASLRDDVSTVGAWLHNHLCRILDREDLLIETHETASSR